MKSITKYITLLLLALFVGCHGDVNDLVVENQKPEPDDKPSEKSGLVLSVDKDTIEADGVDCVTFSLTLDGEELMDSDATLARVDIKHEKSGNALEQYATTFSAVKNGDYSFIATYKGQQSENSVQVKAVNRQKYEPYGQKVMVYDLTGARCPNCPSMTAGLANVDELWQSNMIVLAVHNNDQWALSYQGSDLAESMLAKFGGIGYPSCVYDLQYLNGNARTPSTIGAIIEKHIAVYPATCGVKIESTQLVGNTLTIEAALTSATGGEYEFGYAVLLDKQYYSGGTAVDGIYNDIVVAVSENFMGMGTASINTVANIERTKTFTVEKLSYTDAQNMRVVVFALTKRDGKVYVDNANVCKMGEGADYMAVESYNGIPEPKLTIAADKSTITADGNEQVTFTVKYGNADVSTDKSTNILCTTPSGEQLELAAGANTFTTTIAGEYTFRARYYKGGDIFTDNQVSVSALSAASGDAQNFRHKLLGMQFTSVGCQNCPTLSTVIKSIQSAQPERLIPVSFHIDYTVSDPMKIAMGDTYYNALKGNGLPMFYLDLREGEKMTSSRSVIESEMAKRVENYPPTCGVAITTSYDSSTRQLTITPRIKSNLATSYRYIVMLVEDGIEYEQYGVSGTYTHNNVVRAVLSDNIYGARFNGGQMLTVGTDTPLSTPITTTIASNWKVENMRVVVSALSTTDNKTYYCNNSNECKVGQSTGYALESGDDNSGGDETADVEFNRHVAVFEFTGTWCAMCPSGYVFLKYLIEDWYSHDTVYILAFHDSSQDDPMGLPLTNELFTKFGLGGYPGFVIDMREGTSEKTEIQAMLESSFNDYPATCGVKLTSSLSGTALSVDAELYAAKSGAYRLALYILEDGIVARQNNSGTYKDDYVHNHVVRALVSSMYEGDRVGDIAAGKKATKSYSYTLNDSWVVDNCTLCALVIDSSGCVVNAALCPLNGSVDYDYKK
ncbi:MAG: Omp28-related outer membrane protein [Alistipes sp.]|nr:Omp28-related outer membrane protein [Alistipes sp.]